MIVCSCRVLTDKDFTGTLETEHPGCPRSAVEAYRCLGCGPECGRCLKTVRDVLARARAEAHCGDCTAACALRDGAEPAFLEAAE